jgi:cyclophilin family peptidyl-prolyl cis-trans isomerase
MRGIRSSDREDKKMGRHPKAGAGKNAPGLEPLEPRLMLAATVTSPLPDLLLNKNQAAVTLDMAAYFDDPSLVGTVVRFNTVMGVIPVLLYDMADGGRTAAPLTVANFLHYANGDAGYGSYNNSIVHRSDPGNVDLSLPVESRDAFVIQGGGFTYDNGLWGQVTANSAIANEYSSTRSNVRGTIAMAQVGSNINSATNQWFINLKDNSTNLDTKQFAVFGEVIGGGMAVVDAISALPIYVATGIYSAFNQLPLRNNPISQISPDNPILVNHVSVGKLTYTATTDAPDLLTPTLVDGRLILNAATNLTGTAHVTITGTDIDGGTIQDTFLVTVGAGANPPVVGGLTASPNPVNHRTQPLTLTATGVADPGGEVTRVEFFRDSNGNGTFEPGVDAKLGEDASAAGGWTLALSTDGWSVGVNRIFARAQDNTDNGSAPVSTLVTVLNQAPTLTGISPFVTTSRGSSYAISYDLLKNYSNAADGNNDTIQFRIEQVLSGALTQNGAAVTAGVTLVGPGESVVWTPPDATHFLYNVFTMRAWDGLAASAGSPVKITILVDQAPVIKKATVAPATLTAPGTAIILSATASDPNDAVAKVEFFYDTNNNGVFDASADALLGAGTNAGGKWTLGLSAAATTALRMGPAVFFIRATDAYGLTSVATLNATVNTPPTIASLVVAEPAHRGDRMTLTAIGVADTAPGVVKKVLFYLDSNDNGVLDVGIDKLLGTGKLAAGAAALSVSSAGFPLGSIRFFAQAVDNNGATAAAAATATIRNAPPTVTSLAAKPTGVARTKTVVLTAKGAADKDGAVARVEFWCLAGSGAFDPGTATQIGEDASSKGGYTFTYVIPADAALGALQFFARAVDNNGLAGNAVAASVTVTNLAPTIGGLTAAPNPVTQPADLTLTVAGAVNPDGNGQLAWVRFYEDTNANGRFDVTDHLLGEDTDASDGFSITVASSGLLRTGTVRFLAIAQDTDGATSAAAPATARINPATL